MTYDNLTITMGILASGPSVFSLLNGIRKGLVNRGVGGRGFKVMIELLLVASE